jgi:hypothetical protein
MPYPPCTVTALWLKNRDSARCLRRVTQPPHIAGPLGFIIRINEPGDNTEPKKLQIIWITY